MRNVLAGFVSLFVLLGLGVAAYGTHLRVTATALVNSGNPHNDGCGGRISRVEQALGPRIFGPKAITQAEIRQFDHVEVIATHITERLIERLDLVAWQRAQLLKV